MTSQKRVKMKKSSSSKELLIDFLRTALDFELYRGLGWSDREKKVFYVKWVHKSSEQWSDDDLAPFRAWAAHKGKLDGKNPKQLKATFRCALNSKKELKELSRVDRERRYWQFVDPNTVEKDKIPKKKRKTTKASKVHVESAVDGAYNKDIKPFNDKGVFPLRICSSSEDEMSRPSKLPAFDSFSFQPLTPPDQPNESSYSRPDLKFTRDNITKLEKFDTDSRDIYHRPASNSSLNINNNFTENKSEACTVLPSFEIFGSFRSLTPPPQKNEVCFIKTEYTLNYTPPPDQNRLTPPQKSFHFSRDTFNQSSTDVWQPNCWPVLNEDKEQRNLSDFFSSDFIGLYKSSTQEPESNHAIDFLDMDQYVPVTNTTINLQNHNRIGQSTLPKPPSNPIQTDHFLEKLDDIFLGDYVDPEACRKLMQEIDRTSSVPHYRLHI